MRFLSAVLVVVMCGLFGCDKAASEKHTIVLYTSVDESVVRPLIDRFTQQTGIAVKLQTDTEATKSVGLAERLRAEKSSPRCDVWWGNEVFHTVRLTDEGLFAPYQSPAAKDVRGQYRDAQNRWAGVGIRARVIGVAPSIKDKVHGLSDLVDPQYKGKVCLGNVGIGTISGHVAALYVQWGDEKADAFFKALVANDAKMVGGNTDVAQQIAAGNFLLGLTDNDDIAATQAAGGKIEMALPDQSDVGTLAMPTTVALIQRADVQDDAKKLIDYLLSSETEQQLIAAKYAGWSVRAADTDFRAMKVDYATIAKAMPDTARRSGAILEKR